MLILDLLLLLTINIQQQSITTQRRSSTVRLKIEMKKKVYKKRISEGFDSLSELIMMGCWEIRLVLLPSFPDFS